jgi:hypothetical protein
MSLDSSLISRIDQEVERVEKIIKERISTSNTKNNMNNKIIIDLEEYFAIQSTLEFYISSLYIQSNGQNNNIENNIYSKKKSLKILQKKLYSKFISKDIKRTKFIHELNKLYFASIKNYSENIKEIISNSGKNNTLEENQNILFYNNICNIILKNIDNDIINNLSNIYINNIKKIPEFLICDIHTLIKQKIFIEWSLKYKVLLKDLILSEVDNPDFNYIYKIYRDFFNDKITLFDNKLLFKNSELNLKFKTILFNTIFLSNSKTLNSSSNQKIFFNNATRYLLLFGFDQKKCRFSRIISNCMNMKNISNETKDKNFKELLDLIYTEKNGKIFMFTIWSLSMIFNNIIIYDDTENKISFSPYLKCSSRAKIFLYNFLQKLDNYIFFYGIKFNNSAIEYNAMIENYVFAELTKSYTKVLYDEQNKYKINLTGKYVFKLMQKLCKSGIKNAKKGENLFDDFEENEDSEDGINTENFEFSHLDEIEAAQLYSLFFQFMKKNVILEENNNNKNKNSEKNQNILDILLCNKNIEKEEKNEINFNNNKSIEIDSVIHLNYNEDLLIPVDILNTATQIMICISDSYNNDTINYEIFNFLINQRNIENIDYYIYKWSYDNSSESDDIKAIIYGKLLAYIISSKEVFKFQTISFLGLGKGCQVIKACLDELSIKINSFIDVTDLIQDVIIINSNADFNLEFFDNIINLKLVAGKFINVYKDKKYKIELPKNIKMRMSYSIVGINQQNDKIKDNQYFQNCLPEIYNFDLQNDFKIYEDNEYFYEINHILKTIKEKIYDNY